MEAPAEAAEQRDWLALPAGILQLIFCLASTWQTPGSCLAALVCHVWRAAAAGCSGIRLLYHVGHELTDLCFADWLECNSRQLEALTLRCSGSAHGLIVVVLAGAAAAAQAAGRPLHLHTLRVLQGQVDVGTAGRLLAALPRLRCLQVGISVPYYTWCPAPDSSQVLEALALLQQAGQLEELYLWGPGPFVTKSVAGLFPLTLKRLSWDSVQLRVSYDLSHLTQLTFLRLCHWPLRHLSSSHLPPGLQQLEVGNAGSDLLDVLEEQREVVATWDIEDLEEGEVQRLLPRLPNLTAASVFTGDLCKHGVPAALKQLSKLSALTVCVGDSHSPEDHPVQVAAATAAGMHSLRCLHLVFGNLQRPPALAGLTQLTKLRVSARSVGADLPLVQQHEQEQQQQQQQRAWIAELSRMAGLRWLSVPGVLLAADQAWLSCLQQQLRGCWWCRLNHMPMQLTTAAATAACHGWRGAPRGPYQLHCRCWA